MGNSYLTQSKMRTFIVFAVLLVAAFANPMAEVKSLVQNDKCATESMSLIQPQIEEQIQKLKQHGNDIEAKAELLALVEKAKTIFESCNISQKVEPVLGDAVKAAGIGFLLASNCFKDLGAVLLIADSIIQDPTDITNDVVVLIFVYILGRQGYADCEQFIHYVL